MADDNDVNRVGINKIVKEALDRAQLCLEWEATARTRFVKDIKFANGDSLNGYQWPNDVQNLRKSESKPCLTINMIQQHNLNITNEARKNKSSVKVVPTGDGATVEAGKIWNALIRNTEEVSGAQNIYTNARNFQVEGGIGYWRVVTDYESPNSFNQDAKLLPIVDPLAVLMDCDIKNIDGSDARYAHVFETVHVEQFKKRFPKVDRIVGVQPLGGLTAGLLWDEEDHVLLCEYFRKVEKPDELLSYWDEKEGMRKNLRKSCVPKEVWDAAKATPLAKWRDTSTEVVEWYLIGGDKILDHTIWPGKYIPIVRVVGVERVIDGVMDRRGHTRSMIDAQRMYNYSASAQAEFVGLQTKSSWLSSIKAMEGVETYWDTANIANHSFLPYNHMDDEGNEIPPPQRVQPPAASGAMQEGMNTAFNQMMMSSGQWQNQLGMMGNERTGAAISERKDSSATSTFHFQDNYAAALRFTGLILLDLYPKIYDTKRVKQLLADDGSDLLLEIDPSAEQAYAEFQNRQNQTIMRVLNPTIGSYGIATDVGPAYASKRQESSDKLALILTQAPQLTGLIGDILLNEMDFDSAQEAARRMKRMVPPQALGKGPTEMEQKLGQQVQQLTQLLTTALESGAQDKMKLVGKNQLRDINAYRAETERFKALSDMTQIGQGDLKALVRELVNDALATPLSPIVKANEDDLDTNLGGERKEEGEMRGVEGARQAADGNWYVKDPKRPGKYLRVSYGDGSGSGQ